MHAAAKILPNFGTSEMLHATQSAPQIIAALLAKHLAHTDEYDKLYRQYFANYSADQLPQLVYNFIKNNSTYKVESEFKQTLRSPGSILRAPFIDCKNYSLFIGGVLDAAKRAGKDITWLFRFVSYGTSKVPHHVFIVVNPATDNIYVDPVLPTFNNRKSFTYKIDKYPMALYSMAGIGRKKKNPNKPSRQEKKASRQEKKVVRKQKRAEVKQKIKNRIKKTGKVVLKFAPVTVAARNAFLLLVKINGLNMATKVAAAIQKSEAKVKKLWQGFGGNYDTLKKVAFASANKRAAKIKNSKMGEVATAATVSAATPIIVKLVQLFKELGIDAAAAKKFTGAIINKVIENKIDEQANAEAEQAAEDFDNSSDSGDSFSEDSGDSFSEDSGDSFSEDSGDSFSDDSGDSFSEDSGDSFSDDSGDEMGNIRRRSKALKNINRNNCVTIDSKAKRFQSFGNFI